jgi:hypothetical protein
MAEVKEEWTLAEIQAIEAAVRAGVCLCCNDARRDICRSCGRCRGCRCESWCLKRER